MSEGLILVVDDEEHIRELVRLYLEKAGFTVAVAADGEEAVESAKKLAPQLIILDIMLPWTAYCLREYVSCRAHYYADGQGQEFDKVLGLELGADDI